MAGSPSRDNAPPPARLARRARIMAGVNVPMRLILRLPFRTPLSKALMLLSFTGRKTGKAYRQPVSYAQDGDTLLTPGGGRWKLNLREDQPIKVQLRGRSVLLRPEFVRDVDEVQRLVGRMIVINPRSAGFMPFVGPGGEIERAKVEAAVNYGFAIIRWHFELPGSWRSAQEDSDAPDDQGGVGS
jgi:F420H(2)-dependent quinone reductase